ncbi:hypothetical protein Cgig2_029921 [Carnegiea gigantea]|uniref:Uncharacterized protein n=1 Tax=Carnegiea gigantea TaxID=171969 RepID=A0A9Q1KGZ6_9CARY|nr:hypothetical protein Cgig2_029921 [Carnegiea gigantea]
MDSDLTELRWSTFELWVWYNRRRIMRARLQKIESDWPEGDGSEYHHGLCPNFDLLVVMRYGHNLHIPEMTQAVFYAIVLNNAAKLGLSRPNDEVMSTCNNSSMDGVPTCSSLDGASTSTFLRGPSSSSRRAVLRKSGCAQIQPVLDVMANGTVFPRPPPT